MNEVEQEIKQIQLQRERLALERETALTKASLAAGAVVVQYAPHREVKF